MIEQVAVDIASARGLHHGFLKACHRLPRNIALEVRGSSFQYSDLLREASRFAAALWSIHNGPPGRVAIFADRSVTAYAGILGVLMAGGTYVPMNRRFPIARTAAMCEMADIRAAIVDARCAPHAMQTLSVIRQAVTAVLGDDVDALIRDDWRGPRSVLAGGTAADFSPLPVLGDQPAYLLFTSGTTGVPKGVPVSHANAVSYLVAIGEQYSVEPTDRCSQTFDLTFDLSVHDMFMAWSAGACLVVPEPAELLTPVKYASDRELTVWFSVPSLAALGARRGALTENRLPRLRLSQFCGEALPTQLAVAWSKAAPNSLVANLYGPTELTIACLSHTFNHTHGTAANGFVPIGRPLTNLGCTLLPVEQHDEDHSHSSGSGELCVCGPQTVSGYWNDAVRTKERFVELFCDDGLVRTFYRTGDVVSRDAAGVYQFIGRTDSQVKIGGFRVELGDIEASIATFHGVTQCAVIPWPPAPASHDSILAYVVAQGQVDQEAMRAYLRERLPDYMQPKRVTQSESLPLNANGKIDRAALAALVPS